MNTVIRHIEYLIAHKDCVIIPGVGAILATYMNARIDKNTSILLPPARVFTFNKDINHNDGTLACSIARAESIRYELACNKMEAGIESMLHHLHSDGTLAIGRIGTLCYNKDDGTTQFQPTADSQTACSSMWLPTLKLGNKITIIGQEKAKAKAKDRIIKSPIKENHRFIFKRLSRLAASLALIMGVCFLATLLPVSHNEEAMKASLAPDFGTSSTEETDAVMHGTLTITPSDKYKSYSVIDDDSITNSKAPTLTDIIPATGPRHYIIVAAVRSIEEADRFIAQHSDEGLNAMSYKNLFVVYNSSSADKAEAYQLCRDAVKRYPGAWICTK